MTKIKFHRDLALTQLKALHFLAGFQLSKPTTKGERTFSGVAYAGGVITDHSHYSAVAFDLATTTAEAPLPLLFNHCGSPIGVIETILINSTIEIAGRLFADIDPVAADIAEKSDRGVVWQLSVGIFPEETALITQMTAPTINGNPFTGEVSLLKNNRIREVSFVALGADDKTAATIFNAAPPLSKQDFTMTPADEKAMQDENASLKVTIADLSEKLKGLESANKEQFRAARIEQIKTMFSATQREFTDAAALAYMDLSVEQFGAISGDMIAQAKAAKPALSAELFQSKAVDGIELNREEPVNFSNVYTDRNARGVY